MDILYIIGPNSKNNYFDLKCSLRSIDRYGKNIDRVFVCGYCPDFLNDNIHKLPLDRDRNIPKNKNIWKAILHTIANTDIGKNNNGDFLISMDDHFYIKDVDFDNYPVKAKLTKSIYGGMLPYSRQTTKRERMGYENVLINTHKFCVEHRLPCIFFTLHSNMRINRYAIESMKKINNDIFTHDLGDLECTVIAQNYRLMHKPFRFVFSGDHKFRKAQSIQKLIDANIYDSFSTYDFDETDELYEYLTKLYPDKSKYEK